MTNNQLEILLTLRDNATANLKKFQASTKNAIESMKKNWIALTAAITGAIFAIRKAIELIEMSAKFKQQEQAFRNFASSMNANADSIIIKLREMSGETLSTAQIMQNATRAMALGLAPDALPKLMEISRSAARAFGQDVGFMFDSIVLGIGRQSRMILDNLGIIVSSEEAYKKYASSVGKTVKQLSEAEKKQAFLNEVLKQGENIIARVNIQNKSQLETLQSLSAFWEDLKVKIGDVMIAIIQGTAVMVNVLRSSFASLTVGLTNQFVSMFEIIRGTIDQINMLASMLPGIEDPLQGLSTKLGEMAQTGRDFGKGMQEGADDFATAALDIMSIMKKVEDVHNKVNEAQATSDQVYLEKVKALWDENTKTHMQGLLALGSATASVMGELAIMTGQIWLSQAKIVIETIVSVMKVIIAAVNASLGPLGFLKAALEVTAIVLAAANAFSQIKSQQKALDAIKTQIAVPTIQIPALASGGIVTSPTLALIGERGPEAVVPLGSSGTAFGDINIFIDGGINPEGRSVDAMAEELGFAFESRVRTARGI